MSAETRDAIRRLEDALLRAVKDTTRAIDALLVTQGRVHRLEELVAELQSRVTALDGKAP